MTEENIENTNINQNREELSQTKVLKDVRKKFSIFKVFLVLFILLIISGFTLFWLLFVGGSTNFSQGKIVYIEPGETLSQISKKMKAEGVVRSDFLLTLVISVLDKENKVTSGPYYFDKEESVIEISRRITTSDYQTNSIKVTFPEGFTAKQIANRLKENIPGFNAQKFLTLAEPFEGYLFPETYFFMHDVTPEEVLEIFRETFDLKIDKLKSQIANDKRSFKEIIILASILEKEVQTVDDKKLVAGIMEKRLSIDMALQVDATLTYERGLTSSELTIDDLEKNSPYNTYTNRGYPPTPISNPGLDSIESALDPVKSPYLYFLTDRSGNVHYGKNFEEHKANKAKYLR